MIRDDIRTLLLEKLGQMLPRGIAVPDFSIETPENDAHGDYATNAALVLAKILKKSPMDAAKLLLERPSDIERRLVTKTEIAAPGFINFWIKNDFLLKTLNDALENPSGLGRNDSGKGKTVVVEYFQLNVAKRPHVGHLRSAVIGDAIKRMLLLSGYNAVSDTHVGDWGTQFGILLRGYKEAAADPEFVGLTEKNPFEALENLYIRQSNLAEKDPLLLKDAKEEFAKLERGDPENRKIWRWMIEVSMAELERASARLCLLPFEEHRGESAYEDIMPEIVGEALEKGVAQATPDGAVVVDLSADGLDEAVLVKSDGASTYLLRDLATLKYRKERWNFFKNLYVVDVRQSHHFRQIFRVAGLLGFGGADGSEHIEFGFMSSSEGALSTRKGTAISLDAVLDEAQKRARAAIRDKNPNLTSADAVAEAVGIGALKYFDLSHHRKSDIVFRWDEVLSFEGDTGPYLQYTHARLKSILRKLGTFAFNAPAGAAPDDLERGLLVAISRFADAVEDALKDFAPNIMANYLRGLAKLVNEFYHSRPVTQETDASKQKLRAALTAVAAITLQKGLWCLGIDAPEEM